MDRTKLSKEEIILKVAELLVEILPETQRPVELPPRETIEAKDTPPQKRLIPVPKWNDYHGWPTPSALRNLIFFEETNGFKHCIRRVGRRILIDEEKFFEWVESQN